jgi:hypothetical protein
MRQAREVRVSSTTLSLNLLDEAGEARRIKIEAQKIASLRDALVSAQLPMLASSPGTTGQRCTIELDAVLDGESRHVAESPSMSVNDPAAWLKVQSIIERFAYGPDAS